MPELIAPLVDARLALAIAAVLIAGGLRGFSGFGAAMVVMPALGGLYGPVTAIVVLTLIDAVASLPLLVGAVRLCRWRDIGWLLLPFGVTLQLGIAILATADPLALRIAMAVLILAAVAALATGWRLRRPPSAGRTVAVGSAAGLMGGATGIAGPPIILFWLAGQDDGPVVRANVIVFFALTSVFTLATLASRDLFAAEAVVLAGLLLPAYAGAIGLGAYLFRRSRPERFRPLALGLVALIALASLGL